MSKGQATRHTILDRATELASELGLGGLTIGTLADDLELSKSGLFAHFGSKERLQIAVLDHAAREFQAKVVRPALKQPRGAPRLQAIFDLWTMWARNGPPGGCIFVAAAAELDDQPGPVRDRLVSLQREWLEVIATTVRLAVESGACRSEADAGQFAQDLYGVMLGFHHADRLLDDPEAEARARRAFARLLAEISAVPVPS